MPDKKKKVTIYQLDGRLKACPAPRDEDGRLAWGTVLDDGTPRYSRAYKRHLHVLMDARDNGTPEAQQKAIYLLAVRANEMLPEEQRRTLVHEFPATRDTTRQRRNGIRHSDSDVFNSVYVLSAEQRRMARRSVHIVSTCTRDTCKSVPSTTLQLCAVRDDARRLLDNAKRDLKRADEKPLKSAEKQAARLEKWRETVAEREKAYSAAVQALNDALKCEKKGEKAAK